MAYAVLIGFFAIVWAVTFLLRADLRRDMLVYSVAIAPLGPLSELWFLKDYWVRPTLSGATIGIEDLLFAFFLAGVTFGLYKLLFNIRLAPSDGSRPSKKFIGSAVAITGVCMVVLTNFLGVNSIFASSIAFCIVAALGWWLRPDLIRPSLLSAVVSLGVFVLAYQIVEFALPGTLVSWCLGCNPTGLRPLGINIEELVWDFTWGLVGGVLFEIGGRRTQLPGDGLDALVTTYFLGRIR